MEKLTVSSDWTTKERESVVAAIRARKATLSTEEAKAREICKWESPYLIGLKHQQDELDKLVQIVTVSTPRFLELNRSNFSDYVQ